MNGGTVLSDRPAAIAERRQRDFPGDGDGMVAAREWVMQWVESLRLSESDEIDILVAVQEALANAVTHGSRNDGAKSIHCAVESDDAGISITVRDPGPGFDPDAAVAALGAGNNLGQHGRGILLMRSLMDEVRYDRGGAEIHLRKNLK